MVAGHADERFLEEVRKLASTGMPYLYGANDLSQGGLDCLGFVQVAAKNAWGISLPNEADLQLEYARAHGKVWDKDSHDWSRKVLQPGDLIFWTGTRGSSRPSPVTHVMVYLGDGKIAGAQSAGHRLNAGGHGIGIYPFCLRSPEGDPEAPDDRYYRQSMILYAYARLYPNE
jgi:cell wall-associated NlpC family hydrolase